jgi:hypothetical protein
MSSDDLNPGAVVDGKYEIQHALGNGDARAFVATDQSAKRPVLLIEVPPTRRASLAPAVGIEHAHLAKLHGFVDAGGAVFAVTDHVVGETLQARLSRIEKKTPVDAVRSALRVADAVSALHQAGAVHGLVHPSTVVLAPEGHAAPVVTFGPVDGEPIRSPEHRSSTAPDASDDAYAVAALLFEMLVGRVPPDEGLASEAPLETEVEDEDLRHAIFHGLTCDREQRNLELKPLKRELARWFVKHVGEEPGLHSGPPPPLPSSSSALRVGPSVAPARAVDPGPRRRRTRRVFPLALAGIVLGLLAAWAVVAMRGKKVELVTVPTPRARTAAAAPEIKLGEVPVTGEDQADAGGADKLASCVGGYLPKGTFQKPQAMQWLCSESNAVEGATKLRVAVVAGSGGQVTDAMRTFGKVGWYDMALWAVVRAGCCDDAAAITAPEPSANCTRLDESLTQVGTAATGGQNLDEALRGYDAAVRCEASAGKLATYRQKIAPQAADQAAFREFVKSVQAP